MLKKVNRAGSGELVFFFNPCCMTYGILVPPPGIELVPPALEAWSLNHSTSRQVFLGRFILQQHSFFFFFPLPRYEVAPRSDSEESGSEEEEEVRVRFLAIQALGLCGVTSTTVDAKFLFHPGQTSSGVRDGQGAAEAESSVLRATLFHMVASRHT